MSRSGPGAPRAVEGDPRDLHWQVIRQERAFPQGQSLIVRVYMRDGHPAVVRE